MSETAKLLVTKDFVVVGSKGTLRCFHLQSGAVTFSYDHEFDDTVMDGVGKPLEKGLECICLSRDELYLCAIYSDKKLLVVNCRDWTLVGVVATNRRPTAVNFQTDNSHVLLADKSGDVYRYNVADIKDSETIAKNTDAEAASPILGHVSMMLDIASDDKYIYTADRDEKVRVSKLDHPYVIESYCLGHTEFVCKVESFCADGEAMALSCSGDSTVRLWNAKSGCEIQCLDVCSHFRSDNEPAAGTRVVPSILQMSSDALCFVLSSNQAGFSQVLLFEYGSQSRNFALKSRFEPEDCERVCDVKYGRSADAVFVLSVSKETSLLTLRSYLYSCEEWRLAGGSTAVDAINCSLRDFSVENADAWASLYKCKGDGDVYNSYFKRKADRIDKIMQKTTKQTKLTV